MLKLILFFFSLLVAGNFDGFPCSNLSLTYCELFPYCGRDAYDGYTHCVLDSCFKFVKLSSECDESCEYKHANTYSYCVNSTLHQNEIDRCSLYDAFASTCEQFDERIDEGCKYISVGLESQRACVFDDDYDCKQLKNMEDCRHVLGCAVINDECFFDRCYLVDAYDRCPFECVDVSFSYMGETMPACTVEGNEFDFCNWFVNETATECTKRGCKGRYKFEFFESTTVCTRVGDIGFTVHTPRVNLAMVVMIVFLLIF